MDLKFYVYIIH